MLQTNTIEKLDERTWSNGPLTIHSLSGQPIPTPWDVSHDTGGKDHVMICKAAGTAKYAYNGARARQVSFSKYDFAYMPAGSTVEAVFSRHIPVIVIGLCANMHEGLLQWDPSLPDLCEPLDFQGGLANAERYVSLIDEFLCDPEDHSPSRIESIISLLFSEVRRMVQQPDDEPSTDPQLSPEAVDTIKDYIGANLEDKLRLDTLAALVNVSPFHFARLFKTSTGLTPHQFVIQHRVAEAKSLLASTGLSIAEVALTCGFSSQSHLTTTFQKYVGASPGLFRRLVE